jgi:hypothetical protein
MYFNSYVFLEKKYPFEFLDHHVCDQGACGGAVG